ncbi:hypothetical protein T484DRAFT_1886099, partial [Baffinella frigidus]
MSTGVGHFVGPVLVMLVMLAQPPPHQHSGSSGLASACGGESHSRVWRSGGTAETARRGKCWIDGRCASGGEGRRSSRDDDEAAYRDLGVGADEGACLARAAAHHSHCGNALHQRMRATFVPTGAVAFHPPTQGVEDAAQAHAAIRALRREECVLRAHVGRAHARDHGRADSQGPDGHEGARREGSQCEGVPGAVAGECSGGR